MEGDKCKSTDSYPRGPANTLQQSTQYLAKRVCHHCSSSLTRLSGSMLQCKTHVKSVRREPHFSPTTKHRPVREFCRAFEDITDAQRISRDCDPHSAQLCRCTQ